MNLGCINLRVREKVENGDVRFLLSSTGALRSFVTVFFSFAPLPMSDSRAFLPCCSDLFKAGFSVFACEQLQIQTFSAEYSHKTLMSSAHHTVHETNYTCVQGNLNTYLSEGGRWGRRRWRRHRHVLSSASPPLTGT